MCGSGWSGLALALSVISASGKMSYSHGSDVIAVTHSYVKLDGA